MKVNFKYYFEKILALFRVRQVIGGIEVSDLILRLAYFDGNAWRLGSVRLEPGVVEGGKIKNYEKFVLALKSLKSQVFGAREVKKSVNAIVSLSSVNIYSQVFSLPIIEGENLNKAIELNIQMVSPMDTAQAYSGWQMVGEDKGALRLEVLSAFIDKGVIDDTSRALLDAGFLVVAVESRALALARLVREEAEGLDPGKSYVLFNLDNSGLDFLIIRRGQLYFEYFNPWRDLADDKGQISPASFEAAIVRNLHQVMNFYGQHWPDPLEGIIFSATALKDEAAKVVRDNFSLEIKELKLRVGENIGVEWFIALGCGLRGLKPRGKDKEISLLGIGAEEEFHRERLMSFVEFWKLLLPIAFIFLLAVFSLADLFLVRIRQSLETQLSFNVAAEQTAEGKTLESSARDFNRSVVLIREVQKSAFPKGLFLQEINGLAAANGVALSRFALPAPNSGQPINLSGRAASEDKIISFKNALAADPEFEDVNLPLANIRTGAEGLVFSLTFDLRRQ
jgi:hypothetical protein